MVIIPIEIADKHGIDEVIEIDDAIELIEEEFDEEIHEGELAEYPDDIELSEFLAKKIKKLFANQEKHGISDFYDSDVIEM